MVNMGHFTFRNSQNSTNIDILSTNNAQYTAVSPKSWKDISFSSGVKF